VKATVPRLGKVTWGWGHEHEVDVVSGPLLRGRSTNRSLSSIRAPRGVASTGSGERSTSIVTGGRNAPRSAGLRDGDPRRLTQQPPALVQRQMLATRVPRRRLHLGVRDVAEDGPRLADDVVVAGEHHHRTPNAPASHVLSDGSGTDWPFTRTSGKLVIQCG
jgi:hypothetical protein